MTKSPAFTAVALAASLLAGQAFASSVDAEGRLRQDVQAVSSTTRAQVQAELAQAQRDGSIRVYDAEGRLSERTPAAVKTRDQVKAELADAQRRGDLLANDDSGRKLRELFPTRYTRVE